MQMEKILSAALMQVRHKTSEVYCDHAITNNKSALLSKQPSDSLAAKRIERSFIPLKLRSMFPGIFLRVGIDPRLPVSQRQKIIVLGTGWSSMTFLKQIDITKYDITVVSPKTYFSFTPLLPSVCGGVLNAESCTESIRCHLSRGKKQVMNYYHASATKLDADKKLLECKDNEGKTFHLPYDFLICGVGAEINSFGIPGVAEHSLYLKDAEGAEKINHRMIQCFEKASLPSTSEEMKKELLSFVIVGGGPSGVEVAAEMSDFIRHDAKLHYPDVCQYAKVTLVEMLPKILPSFSPAVSEFALKTLRAISCNVMLKSRVVKLTQNTISIMNENNKEDRLHYGLCLWASGIGQTPFGKHILSVCDYQKSNRVMKVDETLKIGGLPACYAFGDCAFYSPRYLVNSADELFDKAKVGDKASPAWLKKNAKKLGVEYPQVLTYDFKSLDSKQMTKGDFLNLLRDIDLSFRPPPPTAQAAAQEAAYLAKIFNRYYPHVDTVKVPAWHFDYKGSMSYVGNGHAVIQTPYGTMLGGFFSNYLWRAAYFVRLFSASSKIACLADWTRTALFGRQIGNITAKPTSD